MGPRPHLGFFVFKTVTLAPELQVSMGASLQPWLLHAKQRILDQNYKSLWIPAIICVCTQNSDFSFRNTSLYGSMPSSVVLSIHNSDIMTRINSSHGSQTSPVVLCIQNSVINTRNTSDHGSQTSPVVLCLQKMWLASELLVSMGPSPHLWFLHAKQRLLDQNYKALWVPAIICGFVYSKQRL